LHGRVPKPRLEQPALSLSHLTWSIGPTTITTFRTCHPTTSFPVLIAQYRLEACDVNEVGIAAVA
jgi:hypothetical protein